MVENEKKKLPRFAFRLKPEDVELLEPMRVRLGLRSHGAVMRAALRSLAEKLGIKSK